MSVQSRTPSGVGAPSLAVLARRRRVQRARVAELVALRRAARQEQDAPAVRRADAVGRMGG